MESFIDYENLLGELQITLDEINCSTLITIGDFNADPYRGKFGPFIEDFELRTVSTAGTRVYLTICSLI